MMFPLIDVIIILFIAGFVYYGFFVGFIKSLGSFVGFILGALLASRFYLLFYNWFDWLFGSHEALGKVIVFVVLFSIINQLVVLVFHIIEKVFKILTIIPFLKTFNSLLGGILGLVTGVLIVGLILFVISRYAILDSLAGMLLVDSVVTPFIMKIFNIALPLLPEVLKSLKSLI